jgi:thiosulfate reductase cytochrome b subunit
MSIVIGIALLKYHLGHMKLAIGILALAAFFVFATAQLTAGYAGINQGIGPAWALAALFAAVFLRFTLPITVGAFFGAMTVWGWHWAPAFIFAAPGLVFVFPGVISGIFSLATTGSAKLTRATPICAEH